MTLIRLLVGLFNRHTRAPRYTGPERRSGKPNLPEIRYGLD